MDFDIGFNIRRLETFPNNTLKPGTAVTFVIDPKY
jgi:hypothetical protein